MVFVLYSFCSLFFYLPVFKGCLESFETAFIDGVKMGVLKTKFIVCSAFDSIANRVRILCCTERPFTFMENASKQRKYDVTYSK